MDLTEIFHSLFLVSLPLLCVLLGGLCWLVYVRGQSGMEEIRAELDSLIRKLDAIEKQESASRKMEKTELIARFENNGAMEIRIPEKYRHVIQLEQSGIGVRELSEILDVSQSEAEQMLALARSARKPEEAPSPLKPARNHPIRARKEHSRRKEKNEFRNLQRAVGVIGEDAEPGGGGQ